MSNINNLFRLMDEKNISKSTLSKATGISTGNISDWASGRCMPSADKLEILADYLDCSVDYLLGRISLVVTTEKILLKNNKMFTERFNELLNIQNITAYQIAKITGISQGLMNEYKNGVKLPSIKNLVKIANVLDCSVDYLLGRDSYYNSN